MAHMDAPLPRCATTTRRLGDLGRDLAEPSRDVLVGEAVKSVAAHALRIELFGNRKAVGDLGMAPVEGRIEAGDLQQVRLPLQDRADRPEVVGLVKGSERTQPLELLEHRAR